MDQPNNCDAAEIVIKSAKLSTAARLEGNNIFKKKKHVKDDHRKILFLYSKSIAYAPNGSEELASGYSNRSALLSHIKMYQLSITDIDRALQITNSNVLRAKLMCRKIASLKSTSEPAPQSLINEAEKTIKNLDVDSNMKSQLKDLFTEAIRQKIDSSNHPYKTADLPNIKHNTEIPAASSSISMEYNKDYGRHYKANREILPTEILIIEQGYAVAPKDKRFYDICSFCMNIAWAGVPCNNCPYVFYCSKQCEEAAWESYHDLECPILATACKELFPSEYTSLTLRIFIKGLKEDSNQSLNYLLKEFLAAKIVQDKRREGFKNNMFSSDCVRSIFGLNDNFEFVVEALKYNRLDATIKNLLSVLNAKFGKSFCSSEFYPKLQSFNIHNFTEFFLSLYALIELNSFAYDQAHICTCYSSPMQECAAHLGAIIGACTSLLNHSCVPNAKRLFKDGKIIVYAIRPIGKNEQIFHSYGPNVSAPKQMRQGYLSNQYRFTCDCIACKESWDMLTTTMKAKHYQVISQLGHNFYLEIEELFKRSKNGESIPRADTERMIDELKFRLNKIYRSKSLEEVTAGSMVFANYLPCIFELHYGDNLYEPQD